MPLLSVYSVAPDTLLGLWDVSESLDDIFGQYPFLAAEKDSLCKAYKSERRRMEVLIVRLLLREMLGEDVVLSHDADGRPFLSNGFNVSISHTKECVAVIISPTNAVSVDVEHISGRVSRVADRFLRDDEKAVTLNEQLLHWCVKETLYKFYPEDKLAFTDMRLLSIQGDGATGKIIAENMLRGEKSVVLYHIFDSFVLTYMP